jgi:hypothetical protein
MLSSVFHPMLSREPMEKAEILPGAELKRTSSSENQVNFLSNLKSLIVFSKAYLKNCQIDDDRKKIIIKTAHSVFNECKNWEGLFDRYRPFFKNKSINENDHFFYQRAILLAVMIKSYCIGNFMGNNRKKSLRKTADYLCDALNIEVGDKDFEQYGLSFQTEAISQNQQGAKDIKEKRRYKRVKYAAPVSLSIDKEKYITELLDLSLGGAFVSVDSIPQIETGKQISIAIPFVKYASEIELKGTVQHLFGKGAGVEFF